MMADVADPEDEQLELFEKDDVGIDRLWDPLTKIYGVPWPDYAPSGLAMFQIDPEGWRTAIFAEDGAKMTGPRTAIVDTGVLAHHPLLRHRVVERADMTGEGLEDVDGHGSHLAILLALEAPLVPLLIAKVRGTQHTSYAEGVRRVAKGIDWSVQNGAALIILAVGRRGPCRTEEAELCSAVRRALDGGVKVQVAAEARCPAECDSRTLVRGVTSVPSSQQATPDSVGKPFLTRAMTFDTWRAMVESHSA